MNTKFTVLLHNRFVVSTIVGIVSAAGGFATGYIFGKRNSDVSECTQKAFNEVDSNQLELFEYSNNLELNTLLAKEELMVFVDDDSTLYIPMTVEVDEVEAPVKLTDFQIRKQQAVADQMAALTKTDSDQRVLYNKVPSVKNVQTFEPLVIEEIKVPVLEVVKVDDVVEDKARPVNIFANIDPYWNYEHELATRTPTSPYVIHADEYITEESGYRQAVVTYYEGDNTMTNQFDTPIYNHNSVFGDLKFGHGSKDPNVVYIRNEAMRQEWEVILHTGYYTIEVQGLNADAAQEGELLHHQTPRKFRGE